MDARAVGPCMLHQPAEFRRCAFLEKKGYGKTLVVSQVSFPHLFGSSMLDSLASAVVSYFNFVTWHGGSEVALAACA